MHSVDELVASVDAAFVETGRGLAGWENPHPDRMPLAEEYSRVTNPQKWRILGARAEAWLRALAAAGLAEVDADAEVSWEEPPRIDVVRVLRALPLAPGAIPLVLALTRFVEADAQGVVVGVGDPAVVLDVVPDCGCDACDFGSQDALDALDEYVLSVVTGVYRRLRRGKREITVYSQSSQGWSGFDSPWESLGRLVPGRLKGIPLVTTDSLYYAAETGTQPRKLFAHNRKLRRLVRLPIAIVRSSGRRRHYRQMEKALARPKGWHEVRGSSWLEADDQQ